MKRGCIVLLLMFGDPMSVAAGTVAINGAGGQFTVPVTSQQEVRWQRVVRQRFDYSCGSAALSTLLTFHYDQSTPEQTIFKSMFRNGDQNKIRQQGFSLMDMKRYLDERGFNADGFRMTLDAVQRLGVPGIALVDTKGYRHFVVVKGVRDRTVLIGDPAIGTTAVPRAHFEAVWNGVMLAARADVESARQRFNLDRDWRVRPAAMIDDGVRRVDVATLLLTLPGANEFGSR